MTLSRDYRSALQKSAPTASPTYVSFEGYVGGRLLVEALDQAGKDLSREKLIDTFHGMSKLELGGMVFSFSPSNHQGSNAVYITTVKDGKAQPTP